MNTTEKKEKKIEKEKEKISNKNNWNEINFSLFKASAKRDAASSFRSIPSKYLIYSSTWVGSSWNIFFNES